jgi:hypothetical protein
MPVVARKTAIGLVLAFTVLGATAEAEAQDGTLAVAVELEAGAQMALSDSAQLADQEPSFLMTLGGGLYPTRNVRLALEGRFDLAEEMRHHELLGTATYFVDLRLFEVFAGLGVGRYWRDLDGPGFSDEGFVIGMEGGARVGLVGPLSGSVFVSHTIAESQHDDPVWTHATQVGLAVSLKL